MPDLIFSWIGWPWVYDFYRFQCYYHILFNPKGLGNREHNMTSIGSGFNQLLMTIGWPNRLRAVNGWSAYLLRVANGWSGSMLHGHRLVQVK